MTRPDSHIYFAHKHIRKQDGCAYYFNASPSRRWVELHGAEDPIVTVRFRERTESDPPSSYWAWLPTDEPDRYISIWPSEIQLDMCFAYGPKAEEDRGRGRKVNLIVEEIPSP